MFIAGLNLEVKFDMFGGMNPGWCKKCGAAIYWVPRPDGGWFRPMERLKSQLPQEIQDFIDGSQAIRVEDGVVQEFRFSTILVMHNCEKPEEIQQSIQAAVQIPEPTRQLSKKERRKAARALREAELVREADRIEAERIVAERQAAREAQAEKDALKRKTTMGLRYGEVLRADCPYCGAEPGDLCHSMGTGMTTAHMNYYNAKPHQQRADWAYGSGVVEEPLESAYSLLWPETVKDPSVVRQRILLAWLAEHRGLWSEDWPTTSELVAQAEWQDESVR